MIEERKRLNRSMHQHQHTTERDFSFWTPVTLSKSVKGKEDERRIGGVAATESPDIEGDTLLMKGLDVSYLESGRAVFNWNHGKDPGDVVGEVDTVEKRNKELFVAGSLYKGIKKADEIYTLAKALETQSSRRLGFSVEGKIQERDNGKIVKAWVKAIAITHEPVNQDTLATLMKSMAAKGMCVCEDGSSCACSTEIHKALDAGTAQVPTSGGGVLRVQDLEGARLKRKKKGRIYKSFEDTVDGVMELRPNLSRAFAERVVNMIRSGAFQKFSLQRG